MQVILLERVGQLGGMGDTVTVKDGYARNFLLPQGKALRATDANRQRFERERAALEKVNAERRDEAAGEADKIDGETFVLIRQSGESGQLYGSVSSRDIADMIVERGVKVARSQVALNAPIKTVGLHHVAVRLHPEVSTEVIVNVARTVEEAERQARGEDVIASQADEDRAFVEAQAAELFEAGAEEAEEAFAGDDEITPIEMDDVVPAAGDEPATDSEQPA